MNFLIMASEEGATELISVNRQYSQFAAQAIAADVNAVAAAAKKQGYDVYVCNIQEQQIGKAFYRNYSHFLSDFVTPVSFGELKQLIPSCRAAAFVGLPAKAGTAKAFLDRTYKEGWRNCFINGSNVGEIGIFKTILAANGIPVILATGCSAACKEAAEEIEGVYTVQTKCADCRNYAAEISDDSAKIRAEIGKKTAEALDNLDKFEVKNPVVPLEYKIEFLREDYLEVECLTCELYNKGVKRLNARTLVKTVCNAADFDEFIW